MWNLKIGWIQPESCINADNEIPFLAQKVGSLPSGTAMTTEDIDRVIIACHKNCTI